MTRRFWAALLAGSLIFPIGEASATMLTAPDHFAYAQTEIDCCDNTFFDDQLAITPGYAYHMNPIIAAYYDHYNSKFYGANVITPTNGELLAIGYAAAEADLRNGSLHAAAGATGGPFPSYYGGHALAALDDTLFFINPDASVTTVTTIGFELHVDGSADPGAGAQIFASVGYSLDTHTGYDLPPPLDVFEETATNIWQADSISRNYSLWNGCKHTIVYDCYVDDTLSGSFSFKGPAATVPLFLQLYVYGDGGLADFSNTASFSFDPLPTGVSFTSASGKFLVPAAVPEPSSIVLLAGGVLALGLLRHRWPSLKNRRPEAQP